MLWIVDFVFGEHSKNVLCGYSGDQGIQNSAVLESFKTSYPLRTTKKLDCPVSMVDESSDKAEKIHRKTSKQNKNEW